MFSSTRYIICGYHRARLFWNEAIEIYRYPRATPSIFFNLAISRIFFFSLNVFFFFPEANVTRNSFIILSSVHQLLGKRIIRANYQLQLPSRYLAIILRRIFIFFRNFDLTSANLNYLYKILPSSFRQK